MRSCKLFISFLCNYQFNRFRFDICQNILDFNRGQLCVSDLLCECREGDTNKMVVKELFKKVENDYSKLREEYLGLGGNSPSKKNLDKRLIVLWRMRNLLSDGYLIKQCEGCSDYVDCNDCENCDYSYGKYNTVECAKGSHTDEKCKCFKADYTCSFYDEKMRDEWTEGYTIDACIMLKNKCVCSLEYELYTLIMKELIVLNKATEKNVMTMDMWSYPNSESKWDDLLDLYFHFEDILNEEFKIEIPEDLGDSCEYDRKRKSPYYEEDYTYGECYMDEDIDM